LRRKELELVLAKERAEKDQQVREELEKVKMGLLNDKRKVEEDLAAERALNLDKDAQLERSKRRESELEEDVLALQADLDTLDSQLDRALQLQKQSEEQHETLKQAFDQAAEHLVRLEREQKEWQSRGGELNEELAKAQTLVSSLERDRIELEKLSEDLTDLVRQREDDLARLKDRSEGAVKELEGKLASESQSRSAYNPSSPLYIRLLTKSIGISIRPRRTDLRRTFVALENNSQNLLVLPRIIRRSSRRKKPRSIVYAANSRPPNANELAFRNTLRS
jgi:myosin protein heavy chain